MKQGRCSGNSAVQMKFPGFKSLFRGGALLVFAES
jgi:hypothetical protein